MPGSWAQNQVTLDLETPDHSPTCPDCGDLAHPSATLCDGCGAHLLVQGRRTRLDRPARPRCECDGAGVCTFCLLEAYDEGRPL
jgi:hypothetical protein